MPIIKINIIICSPLTALPNHYLMLHTLEDQHFEEADSQQPFLDCLTWHWNKHVPLHARQLEEYSNEAHLSAVISPIQYSESLLQKQDDDVTDYDPSDDDDEYSRLQNPTKAPIISKVFLEHFLTVQSSTGHLKCTMILNFVFVHVQIHPNHGGKK